MLILSRWADEHCILIGSVLTNADTNANAYADADADADAEADAV